MNLVNLLARIVKITLKRICSLRTAGENMLILFAFMISMINCSGQENNVLMGTKLNNLENSCLDFWQIKTQK